MAAKQHSFKLNLEEPTEKELNDFLTGKPTTHIIIEALKLYVKFEEARKAAIDNAISTLGAAPQARTEVAAAKSVQRNDDIEGFDL